MLRNGLFGEGLFDDWMRFPTFRDFDDVEKKLYGRHAAHVMKTDVHENDEGYEVDIDLPGFKKDDINIDISDNTLTIHAERHSEHEEKDKKGKIIRQERYAGAMERSFYVGDAITEEDVKAKFEDGVLRLCIPKKDTQKLPEHKTIMIEG